MTKRLSVQCLYLQCEHEGETATNVQSEATREPEDEPCFKRFKHLSTVVSEKLKEHVISRLSTPDDSPQHQQIEKYLNETIPLREDADVLDFWIQHEQIYPDVSDVAFNILTISTSSAPIERVFSTAGHVSAGKRNRISGQNLEREVLIKKNKSYLLY